jgi:hypothetical protein
MAFPLKNFEFAATFLNLPPALPPPFSPYQAEIIKRMITAPCTTSYTIELRPNFAWVPPWRAQAPDNSFTHSTNNIPTSVSSKWIPQRQTGEPEKPACHVQSVPAVPASDATGLVESLTETRSPRAESSGAGLEASATPLAGAKRKRPLRSPSPKVQAQPSETILNSPVPSDLQSKPTPIIMYDIETLLALQFSSSQSPPTIPARLRRRDKM